MMLFFVLCCVSVLAIAFLIMIAVQLITIEKALNSSVLFTEHQVRKIYRKD